MHKENLDCDKFKKHYKSIKMENTKHTSSVPALLKQFICFFVPMWKYGVDCLTMDAFHWDKEILNMELEEGSKSCSWTKFSERISFIFQPSFHSVFPPASSLHFSYNLSLMIDNISFSSSFSGMPSSHIASHSAFKSNHLLGTFCCSFSSHWCFPSQNPRHL